jgi:hypothetical protein
VAQRIVLDNIKQSLTVSWKGLVSEAKSERAPSLADFLEETGVELEDLYRGNGRSWLDLQRAAGWVEDAPGPDDAALGAALGRMLHVDDLERLRFFQSAAQAETAAETSARLRRMAAMLHFSLFGSRTPFSAMEESLARLLANRGRARSSSS